MIDTTLDCKFPKIGVPGHIGTQSGARLEHACAETAVTAGTLQRWKRCEGLKREAGRP